MNTGCKILGNIPLAKYLTTLTHFSEMGHPSPPSISFCECFIEGQGD